MRHRIFSGWLAATLSSLLLLTAALSVFSRATLAQTPPAAAQEKQDQAKQAQPALEPEAAPVATPGPAAAPPTESTTYLGWLYNSMGMFYCVVFFFLSLTLVALLVMNLLNLRRDNVVPAALAQGFESLLNDKKYQEAYELARTDESFLGQVLSAGLAKISAGYDPAIEAMQEVGEEENMKLEHRISYIALIGTVSPMVGLLGTVQGMVASFQVIATSPTSPKPSQLASGVSMALVTTLVGLYIAIPAVAIYGILRNRVSRLVLEVGIMSEALMSRFSSVGTKKA